MYEEEMNEYINILLNKPEGKPGRDYLNSRGITKDTAIFWKLGYCPVGYKPRCYSNEQFPFWLKMHGGLTIPIFDANGNLVSISRRRVIEIKNRQKNPKYDHYVFGARSTLFGLYQNKSRIFLDNKGIITEGQLDVISAWQKGIKTVVSSFGAHAGKAHLINLSRYTENIFIVYDNDDAGQKGINGALKAARELKIKIKIKKPFAEGVDLDQWVKCHTKDEFYNILEYDKNKFIENKIEKLAQERGILNEQNR